MKGMRNRTASEVVVISSDDENDLPMVSLKPRKAAADSLPTACDLEQPAREDGKTHETKKALKPNFMTTAIDLPHTPASRPRLALARVVSISSSEDDEHDPARSLEPVDPLLYSPVKASHQNDVIDLTLTSSEEEDDSDPDVSDERDVISLLEDSPPLASAPRLKRLFKGSRFPDTVQEIYTPTYNPPISYDEAGPSSTALSSAPSLVEPHSIPSKACNVLSHLIGNLPEHNGNGPEPRKTSAPLKENPFKSRPREPSPGSDSDVERPPPPQIPNSPTKKGKAPRVSKKALQVAEKARREAYAQKLFDELNQSVFKGGLPDGTKLTWSNRLLTTAGRARWRRSRDGTQMTEIELATKVLDCDERIRNTLSHEMCHLACWIINGDPKEGHGRAFKAWAAKVSKKRPEIAVSTRHNYEINYPYEWECDNCAKVYGRYSKSIRPDECRCGTCQVGKLMPLFTTRAARSPAKTKASSQMAATMPDSSRAVYGITDSLLGLTLLPVADAPEIRPQRMVSASRQLGGLEAKLESMTRELGGVNLLNVD